MPFQFKTELDAVEAAARIISLLGVSSNVQMSLAQASRHASQWSEVEKVLLADTRQLMLEIPGYQPPSSGRESLVCLSFFTTPVGDIHIGVFMTMIGKPLPADDGHALLPERKNIERIVICEPGEHINSEDLVAAAIAIAQKYSAEHEVTMLFELQTLKMPRFECQATPENRM